jgi:hypothetical protein
MRSRQLALDQTSGDVLSVIQTGSQNRRVQCLTIRGSGMILPVGTFGVARVKQACVAKRWQFPA